VRQPLKPVEWVSDSLKRVRAFFVARLRHAIYVLHAFRKRSRKTSRPDIDLARRRLQEALRMEALKK
jgi:phage-related protein